MVSELSFLSQSLFSEKKMSFIYSIITLFSKIPYYFNRLSQSSIEIDVIAVKKCMCFQISCKVWKIKVKKVKISVIITIIIEYAWIWLNKQGSECASGLKYVKILNMAKFWMWQGSQYASVSQRSQYARICLDRVLNISRILNMPGSWIW